MSEVASLLLLTVVLGIFIWIISAINKNKAGYQPRRDDDDWWDWWDD